MKFVQKIIIHDNIFLGGETGWVGVEHDTSSFIIS